ncbi:MAG: ABC transporter permease [Ruminococcaceae bacterium]|nr:ABC transporter permease [Oscillospiraceae bacterium]
MKKTNKLSAAYTILMTALTYLPIIVVVVYSFNGSRISSTWDGFSLKWYQSLLRDDAMLEGLFNSVILAFSSSLLAAFIATSAALTIKNARLPMKYAVSKMALLPLIIPEIVLGMVFLAFFELLSLPFGMLTLVIAHTAFCIPYIYTQVSSRLEGMSMVEIEAARDLGASPITAFFTVTLPLIMPAVLSGMFLSFAMSFDDVIISIFVTGVRVNTLPIIVYTQLKTGVSPKINALCAIMLAVTFLCYALAAAVRKFADKKLK